MSRFKPNDDDLRGLIQWHTAITAELQARVIAARNYVKRYRNDPKLLAILDGKDRHDDA